MNLGIHIILLTCIDNNDELKRATREENCQLSKHATQPVTTQCYICYWLADKICVWPCAAQQIFSSTHSQHLPQCCQESTPAPNTQAQNFSSPVKKDKKLILKSSRKKYMQQYAQRITCHAYRELWKLIVKLKSSKINVVTGSLITAHLISYAQ